jgi:hypothetical protein
MIAIETNDLLQEENNNNNSSNNNNNNKNNNNNRNSTRSCARNITRDNKTDFFPETTRSLPTPIHPTHPPTTTTLLI